MSDQNKNAENMTAEKPMTTTHGVDTMTTDPQPGVGATSLHEVGLTRPAEAAASPEERKTSEDLDGTAQRQASDPETSMKTDFDTTDLNASTDQVQGADGQPIENATAAKIAKEGGKIDRANEQAAAKLHNDAEKKMANDANKKAGEKTTKAAAKDTGAATKKAK